MEYSDIINNIVNGKIYTNLNSQKREEWPLYCYHFTDLQNALNIFKNGKICSRHLAQTQKLMKNEDACEDIINGTDPKIFDYARFYLRPQTPMLYQVEGFRPDHYYKYSNKDGDKTKCPFPIYFVFSLPEILNLKNSKFSPISLAVHEEHNLGSTPEEFYNMPFESIYSDKKGRLYKQGFDAKYYTRHEQAEVLVHDSLSLKYLKKIVVRSGADANTLKQKLIDYNLTKYINKIHNDKNDIYFLKERSHGCYFNKVTMTRYGFKAQLVIPDDYICKDNQYISGKDLEQYLGYRFVIEFPNSKRNSIVFPKYEGEYLSKRQCSRYFKNDNNESYIVKLYLNSQKEPAYYNKYNPDQIRPSGLTTKSPKTNNTQSFNDKISDDLPF